MFEAATCKQGLIEAGTRKPDLIVLDLGLPDRSGLEFITDLGVVRLAYPRPFRPLQRRRQDRCPRPRCRRLPDQAASASAN